MGQELVVWLVVAVAVGLGLRHLYLALKGRPEESGCSGCPHREGCQQERSEAQEES